MCDTFVALSQATTDGSVIFGKNSDRPYSEIQNITYYPHDEHKETEIQCTYIKIPQVEETNAVLLSQPYWMFGAEMGANEHGVVIGNEAVWTREPLGPPALLGMDLLRLALERSQTASNALETIVELLERYGQGGACAENDSSLNYHNSFLLADRSEAWVLETAGKWWVAERVKEPTRNISNNLSIRTDYDLAAAGLVDYAREKGFSETTKPFDFAKAFEINWRECSPYSREGIGRRILQDKAGNISPLTIMKLLRNCEAGICMHGGFRSTASMVSQLFSLEIDIHWMTGTPHPCKSMFKPITFPISSLTPYQPATNSPDQNSIWWAHTQLSETKPARLPNWEKKEMEIHSKIQSANDEQFKAISKQAFTIEQEKYLSLIQNSF
ncbi:peptidase C69 [Candidatus Heimdallarchaeota archaeon B3_Heim]|nr:MAG: peptidase C69 [Candidatus Heimdallarchaeota archaeon B3_Heim]